MAGRFSIPIEQQMDENGNPLAGGKLEFFESGTSTPLDTFSDDDLTVANPNPVVADSAGRFGDIFLTGADYKVVLKKADDSVIWTADPVRSPTPKSTVVLDVSTTTQLSVADDGKFVAADATSGAFIVTLPAVADAGDGYEITIQKVDSSTNVVTVDGSGSETINGVSDLKLSDQYASATFRCDGITWYAYAITPTTETRILAPGFINGFQTANNGADSDHDIDIDVGSARGDTDTGNIILSSLITKRIDAAFAEGSNQGGLDTGNVAADSWYHLWAISKTDGTADVLFSLSVSAPTLPSGFTQKRRIGAVLTDSSENILGFVQRGDCFLWKQTKLDIDENVSTTAEIKTISVPLGVKVQASANIGLGTGGTLRCYVSSPDVDDEAPSATAAPLASAVGVSGVGGNQVSVITDTSSQIRVRCTGSTTVRFATLGWIDARGKL